MIADIEELENMDASDVHPPRINKRKEYFKFPVADGTAQFRKRLRNSENPLQRGNNLKGVKISVGNFKLELAELQPTDSKDDAEARAVEFNFMCLQQKHSPLH